MNEASGLTFPIVGTTGYGSAIRTFEAKVELAELATAAKKQLPLFVFPKGTTVVAARIRVLEAADSAANATYKVGTYKIADGALGAAIDDDLLFAGVAMAGKVEGDVISPAAAAHGALVTEDAAVVATLVSASDAPKDPTEGEVLVEVWALP